MLAVVSLLVPLGLLAFFLRDGSDDDDRQTSPSAPGNGVVPGAPAVGDPAPGFTLESLDGDEVSLADYRGRVVLLNFWASWCVPCRKEFPLLQEAHEREGAVVVLAVIYNDLESDARAFMKETGVTFPALLDPEGNVARDYGIVGIPQTFLIDQQGVVRDHLLGIARRTDLEEPVDALLDGADG